MGGLLGYREGGVRPGERLLKLQFFAARAQNRMNSLLRCIQQIFVWPPGRGAYLLLPGEMSVRA